MNRRNFLAKLTHLFSLALGALITLPVFRFLLESLKEQSDSSWVSILSADANIATDEFVQISFKRLVQNGWTRQLVEELVWVRKKADGSFIVFNPHCTHLGCAFGWNSNSKEFQCPCHGGKFDRDGKRIAGPPPRPLDRYETKVENNVLKIGKLMKA